MIIQTENQVLAYLRSCVNEAVTQAIGTHQKSQRFLGAIVEYVWIRVLYTLCIMIISLINIALTWKIFQDVMSQEPGLVFGQTQNGIIAAILIFGVIEFSCYFIGLVVWGNFMCGRSGSSVMTELVALVNLLITQVPLTSVYLRMTTCSEFIISTSIVAKSALFIVTAVVHLVIILTVLSKTGESDLSSRTDPSGTTNSSVIDIERTEKIDKPTNTDEQHYDIDKVVPSKIRYVVRTLLLLAIIVTIVMNSFIFKMAKTQEYHGFMEWRHVASEYRNSLVDEMAEKYLENVEVFLHDREINNGKWLHLVSLEKLIDLQRHGIRQQVGLKYIQVADEIYNIFSQVLFYPNSTTEFSMTCWQIVNIDEFQETGCPTLLESNFKDVKNLKILFNYVPPSHRRHLGALFYNASGINLK